MSLSATMATARSSLSTLSERTSIVSKNVANAGNNFATRKVAQLSATAYGVEISSITRVADQALFENITSSNSDAGRQDAIVQSLDQLNATISDVEQDASPAAAIGRLADALQQYAAAPQDTALGQNAGSAAVNVARTLNEATANVQQVRGRADEQIAAAVDDLNSMLTEFTQINRDVVKGSRVGDDVTNLLDKRDQLLENISREIGIRTVTREHQDVAIYTDSGVTLFENTPRSVSFSASGAFTAATTGNAVFIDGVDVTSSTSPLPLNSGRITGLVEVRDRIGVTYQNQLDEIARGVITNFAESDQSATPSLPDATGAFSYAGSPTVPPAGTLVPGLAGQIQINPAVDPTQGGDVALLRDGGINGAAYVYNSSGAEGFSDRLRSLQDGFYNSISFDPAAEIDTSTTLISFSSDSIGWLQETRQTAASEFEFRSAVFERSVESFSQVTGVNLDFEMTLLLELERSYQATSRLISTIDSMYESLLAAG